MSTYFQLIVGLLHLNEIINDLYINLIYIYDNNNKKKNIGQSDVLFKDPLDVRWVYCLPCSWWVLGSSIKVDIIFHN